MEDFVIQGLNTGGDGSDCYVLNLFHISAVQHGNVIEVKTGLRRDR